MECFKCKQPGTNIRERYPVEFYGKQVKLQGDPMRCLLCLMTEFNEKLALCLKRGFIKPTDQEPGIEVDWEVYSKTDFEDEQQTFAEVSRPGLLAGALFLL